MNVILLMLEAPAGSEQTIIGIAGNEKEAAQMAENVYKIKKEGSLRILGYEVERGIILNYYHFLEPRVYASR